MKIEYFYGIPSPFAYLGSAKLMSIAKKHSAEIIEKPCDLVGGIFTKTGGLPVPQRSIQRQKYRLQELRRWSEFLKINLNIEPKFFPSRSLLPSLAIISAKILNYDNVMEIAYKIMEGLWIKQLDIDDELTLKSIISKIIPTADELIDHTNQKIVADEIKKNTEKALISQVFGAPTYVIDDQVFWGQDRLDFVERYVKRKISLENIK